MRMTQFTEDGLFEPRKIAAILRTSLEEVALTVGLGKEPFSGGPEFNRIKRSVVCANWSKC